MPRRLIAGPDTMQKVYDSLRRAGLDDTQTTDTVTDMQNGGIYFREVSYSSGHREDIHALMWLALTIAWYISDGLLFGNWVHDLILIASVVTIKLFWNQVKYIWGRRKYNKRNSDVSN